MIIPKTKQTQSHNVVAYISPYMTNIVNLRNPYVIAWWSAAFPGFGHLILGHYVIGLILIIHEIIINSLSGLNTAIYYSMIGEMDTAKQVLDTKWIVAYLTPYIFAIWDSYQRSVVQNDEFILAQRRGYEILSRNISSLGMNRIQQKNPWVAIIWSVLAPGAGHLYINRTPIAFLVPWFVATVYFSHLLPAVHHTMEGDFLSARLLLDPQWLLFLPSIYGFLIYDAYLHALENNQVYAWVQTKVLRETYQDGRFPIHSMKIARDSG